MSRAFSSSALRALYAEEAGDYPILLITISDPSLTTPVRVSSDPTQRVEETDQDIIYGTVSRGETYFFLPFNIKLPTDEADSAPKASLSIDNVSRELIPVIRSLTNPPEVTLELVMASDPDTVEAEFPQFILSSISYDSLTISGDLTVDMLVSEPFPAGKFNPSQFPGLF